MYTYQEEKRKRLFGDIEDYLIDRGMYDKSRYVNLANQINREELCEPIKEAYCTNNGRPSINVRCMLALEILKHLLKMSDEDLVKQLQMNVEVKYFCGFTNIYDDTNMSSSSLTHFRNRINENKNIREKIQSVHLRETIKKIPKNK